MQVSLIYINLLGQFNKLSITEEIGKIRRFIQLPLRRPKTRDSLNLPSYPQ